MRLFAWFLLCSGGSVFGSQPLFPDEKIIDGNDGLLQDVMDITGDDSLKIKAKDVSDSIGKALDVHLEKEDGSNSLLRSRSINELPQRERHLNFYAAIIDWFTGCPQENKFHPHPTSHPSSP